MADSLELRAQDNLKPLVRPSGLRVEILECTLRDGSYAVDFKFTENDTAILAGGVSRLGFRWIEVGQRVRFGAAKAGKRTLQGRAGGIIEGDQRAHRAAKMGVVLIPG